MQDHQISHNFSAKAEISETCNPIGIASKVITLSSSVNKNEKLKAPSSLKTSGNNKPKT
jgi:hypothetical protein